jgi:hypothetical protein
VNVCMNAKCSLTVQVGHNFHYTMHGRQIAYPFGCHTLYKLLRPSILISFLKRVIKVDAERKFKQTR